MASVHVDALVSTRILAKSCNLFQLVAIIIYKAHSLINRLQCQSSHISLHRGTVKPLSRKM